MANPIKSVLLNRGWAGKTITREETVERLNPIIEAHIRLNRAYGYVVAEHPNEHVTDGLGALQKTARADVGKLSETVLSCGGVAYNGTDIPRGSISLGDDPADMLLQLKDQEQAFQERLRDELDDINHQIRTRAILEVVKRNSAERLQVLRKMTSR
ncbi:hypothetical protein [Salisaeta longa]|uniref:hypothetical protein n=1 Tax=Salisaeta longa TaxID=503170 RepID=UPI0003B60C50|nr:hypothetical protein [Salisaeta longa]